MVRAVSDDTVTRLRKCTRSIEQLGDKDNGLARLMVEAANEITRLRAACRALAGIAPDVLASVTPAALRAVLTARGWTLDLAHDQHEWWRCPVPAANLPSAFGNVVVFPARGTTLAQTLTDFCNAASARHGIAPAELLAEVLAAVDRGEAP
jgi:hypothetical protein